MPISEVKITELTLELGECITLHLRRPDGSQREATVSLSKCGEMVVHDEDGMVREEKWGWK